MRVRPLLVRGLPALLAVLLLAGLQVALLSSPTTVSDTRSSRDGNRLVAYELESDQARIGEPVALILHYERPVPQDQLPTVRFVKALGVDPVVAPLERALTSDSREKLRLAPVPPVTPGTWKLQVGGARPFGLLRVTP